MKITAGTWTQMRKNPSLRDSSSAEGSANNTYSTDQTLEDSEEMQAQPGTDTSEALENSSKTASQQDSSTLGLSTDSSQSSNKIKASVPDDQVGLLASQLASSQTKFDVQQVSARAMRALANLRISGSLCEDKDKEKVAQMIRRMEKLLKRVRTKLKNLAKEEQLEQRQKRAEEKKKEQEAKTLRDELRNRRNKRHKDEWNYALKEAAKGSTGTGTSNSILSKASTGTASSLPTALSSVSADVAVSADIAAAPAMDSVSLDVTV